MIALRKLMSLKDACGQSFIYFLQVNAATFTSKYKRTCGGGDSF
jgi:hypothetical protein